MDIHINISSILLLHHIHTSIYTYTYIFPSFSSLSFSLHRIIHQQQIQPSTANYYFACLKRNNYNNNKSSSSSSSMQSIQSASIPGPSSASSSPSSSPSTSSSSTAINNVDTSMRDNVFLAASLLISMALYCITPLLEYNLRHQGDYSNTNVVPSSTAAVAAMRRRRKYTIENMKGENITMNNGNNNKNNNKRDKVIVLDLDECLIHASPKQSRTSYPIQLIDQRENEVVWIQERPYLQEFLLFCHQHFEKVFLFTAGEECYAIPIVENIIMKYNLPPFTQVFSRADCNFDNHLSPLKDIKKACPDLSKVFLIDDNPRVINDWPSNSIRIRPFTPNKNSSRRARSDTNTTVMTTATAATATTVAFDTSDTGSVRGVLSQQQQQQLKDAELVRLMPLLQKISLFDGDIRDQLNSYSVYGTL